MKRWWVLLWVLNACQVVGPRPPVVFDGLPPQKINTAELLLVKGDVIDQQVAVVRSFRDVRSLHFEDVRALPVRRDGDHIVVQGPEGDLRAPIAEITGVTFTGPDIHRWRVGRRATTWGATAGLVLGGVVFGTFVLSGELDLNRDVAQIVTLGPLLVGGYAVVGSAVGYVVGMVVPGDLTLTREQGWVPVVPPKK